MEMEDEEYRSRLGRIVRQRRSELGYSQEAFADEAGMHRTYFGAIERGERNVALHNLLRVSGKLGIPLSELLREAESDVAGQEGDAHGNR